MKAIGLALATVLLASPAMAMPAPLPFGLDAVRLGMSLAEVEPVLSGLAPTIPNSPSGTPQAPALFIGPYHWHDCIFDIGLYFEGKLGLPQGHLGGVALFLPVNTSDKCFRDSFEELATHFGKEDAAARGLFGSQASYNAWEQPGPHSEARGVALLRRLKAPLPIRYFEDLDDAITSSSVLSSGAGSILFEEIPGGDIAATPG